MLAVKIAESQPTQFGDANACVVEHPEDGAVARSSAVGNWPRFVGWRTGEQEPFKFLGSMVWMSGLPTLGNDDPIKGVAFNHLPAHQPVEKGTGGAGIGLDGALGSRLPWPPGLLRMCANQALMSGASISPTRVIPRSSSR